MPKAQIKKKKKEKEKNSQRPKTKLPSPIVTLEQLASLAG